MIFRDSCKRLDRNVLETVFNRNAIDAVINTNSKGTAINKTKTKNIMANLPRP